MTQLTALQRYQARKAAGSPGLNPPEAEKVLATETTAETEARPSVAAPPVAAPAPEPAPEVSAPSAAPEEQTKVDGRTKAGRARRAAGSGAAPAVEGSAELSSLSTEDLRDELARRGWHVSLGSK